MTTRTLVPFFAYMFLSAAAWAASMDFRAQTGVNSAVLSWEEVEGAVWYDLYRGEDFVARHPADVFSHSLEHLDQDTEYRYVIGARDAEGATLAAAAVEFETSNYNGTYVWVNTSGDDNNGKLTRIEYTATLAEHPEYGQYMTIEATTMGKTMRIFPLQPLVGPWDWLGYKDGNAMSEAYRANCEMFNTLPISPSRFRTVSVSLSTDVMSCVIVTQALGIRLESESVYQFGEDGEGAFLRYSTDGGGLVTSALFKNPDNPDDPHSYILRRV